MGRRLINLEVDFIALVKKPANNKPVLLKSGTARTFQITKADDETQRVYGIVYSPEQEDLQGDVADAETIRKAADRFMREGLQKNIDLEHSFTPEPNTYVAESWLTQKGDSRFSEEPVGSWAVGIQIAKTEIWDRFKAGELTGLSLAGNAIAKSVDEGVPSWFKKIFSSNEAAPTAKEKDMTKEEIAEIVQKEIARNNATQKSHSNKTELVWDEMKKYIDESIAKSLEKGKGESATFVVNSRQNDEVYI